MRPENFPLFSTRVLRDWKTVQSIMAQQRAIYFLEKVDSPSLTVRYTNSMTGNSLFARYLNYCFFFLLEKTRTPKILIQPERPFMIVVCQITNMNV